MIETEQTVLSPEEAGAFVAQWAVQHRVGVAELASRLGVSEDQAESLMRQARGRLAMDQWLTSKQPKSQKVFRLWPVLGAGLLVGIGLGAFATAMFWPPSTPGYASAALPTPQFEVKTSDPIRPTPHAFALSPGGQGNPGGTPRGVMPAPRAQINGGTPSVTQMAGGFSMGHVVAAPSDGLRMPRPPIGTGSHPVPVGSVLGDHKPTSVNDEMKVPIPDDIILEIRSPHGALIVNGKKTNNLRTALGLRREGLCEAIRALIACFTAHGLAPTPTEIKSDMGRRVDLQIWIGSVHIDEPLDWDAPKGDLIRQVTGNPYSVFYDILQPNLTHQMKLAGTHLFLFNSQAPEVR